MLGIIGIGNMGGAILQGILSKGLLSPKDICVFDRNEEKLLGFAEDGLNTARDELELINKSDRLILAIKPQSFEELSKKLKGKIASDKLIISIAAGINLEKLSELFGDHKFIRVMPNTPLLIGQGMTALCKNKLATDEDLEETLKIFMALGDATIIEESQVDAFSGICACMPAYVYMFIEAAADAAVKNGIKREDAYRFISRTFAGSANMVLETGKHPGQLKDQVTSPGGTTIRGVLALEREAFRNAVIKAVDESSNYKIEL